MEVIIGREEKGQRLHLAVGDKHAYMGTPGCVPKTVSRMHCKLTFQEEGKYVLENLKLENVTYVNGNLIAKKTVREADRLELGSDRYAVKVGDVVAEVRKLTPQELSLAHLKAVWEQYQDDKLAMQIQQSRSAAIQSVSGILSMLSIACGFIPGVSNVLRIVFYGLALVLSVYFMVCRYKNADKYPKQLKALDDRLHHDYVCPNPACGRFLGYMPYEDLVKSQKKCPICQAVYKSEATQP
ncbi:MAG: FHA domain-containing protein [Bacteroidales bacterium]|nr:FHA domain-containing protein [Bacteroidales bacterium]